MGILDQLSSATGDQGSNLRLVKECLLTPALLHSLAEGLRTGTPAAQDDCVAIFSEVARRRPEILPRFIGDLMEAGLGRRKPLARKALQVLTLVAPQAPSEIFTLREPLLEAARAGGADGLAALGLLAGAYQVSANYRGKLLLHLLRLLDPLPGKELLRWVKALGPAVAGSEEGVRRLQARLEPRRAELDAEGARKLDALLVKLGRPAGRRRAG